jgi:hemoglobin/transferrin/lactoferrin receptor protein
MSKRLLIIFFSVIVLPISLFSQVVTVFDQQTGKPINDVLVYNKSKTATTITTENGTFNLNVFTKKDTLIFKHNSFYTFSVPVNVIVEKGNRVMLNQRLFDLNEVVVSANRWEVNKKEVPNEIEVIKSKEIVFNNPATSADMLMQSGDVFVQKSQLGGGSPMIRGFAANRILFVVDGVRMNNAIYRSGNLQNILQSDVNSIQSAEIIFGPGTNIYGSDALGGVMDIHIQNPVMTNNKIWNTNGSLLARYSSAATEKTGHISLNISNNKWGFLTLATFSDFDDLKMGNYGNDFYLRKDYVTTVDGNDSIVKNQNPLKQRFSGYSQLNIIQKISYNIDNKSVLNVNFYFSGTSDVPRYDRLLQKKNDKLKYAQWYYKPQQWIMASTQYINHKKKKLSDNYKIVAAYQNVKEGRNDRKFENEWLRKRKEKVDIASLNVDVDKSLGNGQTLFYGLEAVYNNVSSTGVEENIYSLEENIIPSRYPDGGSDIINAGMYATYKKNFSSIPMTVQAGVRFSYSYLKANFKDTSWYHFPYTDIILSSGAVTPSAGVIYHPKSWKLSLNLSSGFRAPNLDDVAKVFDSEPGNVVVPNENLNPEYLFNTDITAEKSFKILKVTATVFYSYLFNAMVRDDFTLNGQDSMMYDGEMSKIQAVVNTGYANVYGVNGSLSLQIFRSLGINAKSTFIKGFDNKGNPLRHVSPLFGKVYIIYEYKKLQLQLGTLFNGKISYNQMAPSERDKEFLYAKDQNGNPYSPGWWTINFKGSFAFSQHWFFTAGVENMLNKRYRPYSSGITAPGINVVITLRVSF